MSPGLLCIPPFFPGFDVLFAHSRRCLIRSRRLCFVLSMSASICIGDSRNLFRLLWLLELTLSLLAYVSFPFTILSPFFLAWCNTSSMFPIVKFSLFHGSCGFVTFSSIIMCNIAMWVLFVNYRDKWLIPQQLTEIVVLVTNAWIWGSRTRWLEYFFYSFKRNAPYFGRFSYVRTHARTTLLYRQEL